MTSVLTADLAWYAIPMTPLLRFNLSRTIREFLKQLGDRAERAA